MNTAEAKDYLSNRQIPQLFESMLTGLMYYRPDNPVEYLENCLKKVKELGGPERVRWDTFVAQEKKMLPPLNGCQARRPLFRNVLPDSANFPYRRYDRLPPIHQFSIESDTDLSETSELIEEYMVFDPVKARPWIILLIGGPGSGKGTQSLKIAQRYGFECISVGELLRKKMIHNTTCNRKWSLIAKIITNGELAPQETTITEIKRRLMQLPDAQGFVIDGFPRDVAQVLSFEDQICTPDLVVFLACANHQLKERLEKRALQQGRPDDNPKAIQRRLTTFKQNTIPLVKYFQERGLIVTLDADRDEEEVFYDISVTVDRKLFPTKDPVAGPSELDLSLLVDLTDAVESDSEDWIDNQPATPEGTKLEENLKQTKIIFVIGGPGSGKGTQSRRVAEEYGFTHLSAQDILRNTMVAGSDRRKETQETVEHGDLVPVILKDAMMSMDAKGILIDDYPWELKQAEEFEKKVARPSLVLFLSCSRATMKRRLLKSARKSDQVTGDEELITKQIEDYLSATQLIIEKYQRDNLIRKICENVLLVFCCKLLVQLLGEISSMFCIARQNDSVCFTLNIFFCRLGIFKVAVATVPKRHYAQIDRRPECALLLHTQHCAHAQNGHLPDGVFALTVHVQMSDF
ncbi:adenylate kinase isoenzyme 5 isoform X2 [Scyliorhinus canicula]|uniref:adenylate kinase isoenzyme 5 isoform X2 n=1 Tax=Scyliorhinus canicula TaxID=7830 RepID=UPI0018F539EC|nr:adenylate kinase isoenzyme 5 isoform X2 [Scyliorhinus canicula]